MADYIIRNYSVEKIGQQVIVKGQMIDSKTNQEIATFGQNGINVVTWFQQLPADAQLNLTRDKIAPTMVRWLTGEWTGSGIE
jgi:hypothetical protein